MERKYGIDIKWLAVTCFEIRFDGFTVVSDPFVTDCVGTDLTYQAIEQCDAIVLSHAHWDHITDMPALGAKFKPKVLCGDQTATPLARWLNYDPALLYPMYPDTELTLGGVKIRAVYGRHKSLGKGLRDLCQSLADEELCRRDAGVAALQEVGSMEYRNYLFTTPEGVRLFLWGGEPTEEQFAIGKALSPDIVIVQRGKDSDAIAKRAEFAAQIGAKVFIPHHHDFKGVDDPSVIERSREAFLRLVPDGRFVAPAHGEWVHL